MTAPGAQRHEPDPRADPEAVRRLATRALAEENWESAAYHYGVLAELEPEDADLLLRYARSLRQAGLPSKAADACRRASTLRPRDAEIAFERGLIARQTWQFAEACRHFEAARRLGYPDAARIARELDLLLRRHDGVARVGRPSTEVRFFLSCAVSPMWQETPRSLGDTLGLKNYSYGFIVKGYREALDAIGQPYEMIARPEFIPDIGGRSAAEVDIHLGFHPPEAPRLLKGAYNIMVVAWEFERLHRPHETMRYHAFADPAAMLRLCDEVWSLSEYGAEALRGSLGSHPVSTVPTPLLSGVLDRPRVTRPSEDRIFKIAQRLDGISWRPLAAGGAIQRELYAESRRRISCLTDVLKNGACDRPPVLFVSVFNVFDARKQIKPMLDAFVQLTLECPNAFLLLKMSFPDHRAGDWNEALFLHQILDPGEVAPILVSDRIWISADVFSRDDLNALYDIAAFYISTAHGEGQNLPLLEAMGRGAVPVSVDHTAMRDYISSSNAVVVPSRPGPFSPRLSGRYGLRDISTHFVGARDAAAALETAMTLSDSAYADRSAAALAVVKDRFGLAPFRRSIEHAIEAATRARAPAWSGGG